MSSMTKAEEAAMKAYPNDSFVSVEYADMCRSFFQEGYELAEKDLALTWEDIRTICLLTIGAEVVHDNPDLADNVQEKLEQVFYEDVLRRFREMKNK